MAHRAPPPLPPERPVRFRTTVHGTVFCERARNINQVTPGDELLLIPGPPIDDDPGLWVHLPGGELIGHLPPEIEAWLTPWILRGGRATATVLRVHDDSVPSWRRLLVEVRLRE
jgi:hypothetical protein